MNAIKFSNAINKIAGLVANQKCTSNNFLNTRDEMLRMFTEVESALKKENLTATERELLCKMHNNISFALHEHKFHLKLASLAFNVLLIKPCGKKEYLHKEKIINAEGWMSAVNQVLEKVGVKDKERYLIGLISPTRHGTTIEKMCELLMINKRKVEKIIKRNPKQFYCLILATKNYDKFNINYQYKDPRILSILTGFSESRVNKHITSTSKLYSMTFFGASVRTLEYELLQLK